MELNDYRWSALARYHDATLESALLLLALARRPTHSHYDIALNEIIGVRSSIRMMAEMQVFCLNARKSIELANQQDPAILSIAHKMLMPSAGSRVIAFNEDAGAVTDQSFMWIIGRILHSVSTVVLPEMTIGQVTQTMIPSVSVYKYFGFESDWDRAANPNQPHPTNFIIIEEFIASYVATSLSSFVESAIRKSRPDLSAT